MSLPNIYLLKNRHQGKSFLFDDIGENKFQVREFGDFRPLLANNIIDSEIAKILNRYVSNQIFSIRPITIYRQATNEEWFGYSEVIFKNDLMLEDFANVKTDDFQIYFLMYNDIYVSSDLKKIIETEYKRQDELEFVKDWPMYA